MYVEFETVLEDSEGNEYEVTVEAVTSKDRHSAELRSVYYILKDEKTGEYSYDEFTDDDYDKLAGKDHDFLVQEAIDRSREY